VNSITPSRTHIKRRVDDYLWRGDELPIRRLRELLDSQFLPFGEVAIIGGLVRDIARSGPRGFRSDVDLVLNASPKAVERIAARLGAKRNRFGGFGLITPLWKIDFWALRNTWAHQEGYASIRSLNDLLKSTFFNIDAIIYIINSRQLVADEKYILQLLSGCLEINLLPNPSIDGNLVRSVRRLLGWNMRPGLRLTDFLEENLTARMFEHVKVTEWELYRYSYAAQYDTKDDLLAALRTPSIRHGKLSGSALQYQLPL